MKRKKIMILMIVAILCCLSGILFEIIEKDSSKKLDDTGNSSKNTLVLPESVAVSKLDDYVQQAYINVLAKDDPEAYFSASSINLQELVLSDSYQDCSGTLQFVPNGNFRSWNFQASCSNSSENATKIISAVDSNIHFIKSLKVKNGIAVLLSLSSSDVALLFFDDNYNLQWEKHIQESKDATLYAYDLYKTEDDLYFLGRVHGNISGELATIADGETEFSFLVKYDLSGNRTSFINIEHLCSTSISPVFSIDKVENEKVYLSSQDSIIVVQEEQSANVVNIIKDINEKYIIAGVTDSNQYYAYNNVEVENKDENYTVGNVFLTNQEGVPLWNVSLSDFTTCNSNNSCFILNIYSHKDQLFVMIPYQVLIFDNQGKLLKLFDYRSVQTDDKITAKANVVDILFQDDTYSIISFIDDHHLYIENYDEKHQLNLQKNYSISGLYMLYGLSDLTIFDLDEEHLTVYFLINEFYGTLASVKVF